MEVTGAYFPSLKYPKPSTRVSDRTRIKEMNGEWRLTWYELVPDGLRHIPGPLALRRLEQEVGLFVKLLIYEGQRNPLRDAFKTVVVIMVASAVLDDLATLGGTKADAGAKGHTCHEDVAACPEEPEQRAQPT